MVKKVQLPVIGGVRKTITIPDITPGTTIAGFAAQTLTIAQLRQLLGVVTPPLGGGNIGGGGGTGAAIILGPGLSGGGPLVGNVPINLTAPIPVFIFDDGGGDGDGGSGPPGQRGADGATGSQGPAGPAIYLSANDGEDGFMAVPGNPGAAGTNGATGAPGTAGPAIYLTAEPGEDGWNAIPGNPGAAGTNGATGAQGPVGPALMFFAQDGEDGAAGPPGVSGTGGGVTSPFNVTPDTHLALPTGVGLGPNDEFETGSSIDTAGTRYAGATPWTAFNAVTGTTTNVDSGSLVLTAANVTLSNNGYSQPIVGATWEYTCRLAITMQSAAAYGMLLATAAGASGAILQIVVYSGTTAYAQRYNSATSFNSNMANTAVSAQFNYLRVGYDGTNLNLYVSTTGVGSTFVLLYSETPAAFLGSVPTLVAVSGNINGGNAASQGVFDWFRRTA